MQDGPIRKAEMDSLLKEKKNQILLIRLFDFLFALTGLIILSPLFLILSMAVITDSPGPALFKQLRIGKDGKPFHIYKFRSMVVDAEKKGNLVTASGDPRQTRLGKLLRKLKLDELPQLINVLKGEMALVGPRPEVPKYVAYYDELGHQVLRIKPGVTDVASIVFKDESEILAEYEDPEREYIKQIIPLKHRLNMQYIKQMSLKESIRIILITVGFLKYKSIVPVEIKRGRKNVTRKN